MDDSKCGNSRRAAASLVTGYANDGPTTKRLKVGSSTASVLPPPVEFPSTISIASAHKAKGAFLSCHFSSNTTSLSPRACQLWSSTLGAKYAALNHEPAHTCRRLGVITRVLEVTANGHGKTIFKPSPARACPKPKSTKANPPTLPQARKAIKEEQTGGAINGDPVVVEQEARKLQQEWAAILKSGTITPAWDERGEIHQIPLQIASQNRTTIARLIRLLEGKALQDADGNPRVVSLYNGLSQTKVDSLSVLRALHDVMTPHPQLYDMPLVVTCPTLEPIPNNGSSVYGAYRLTIGVYAHRLLYECMTATTLQMVMAALDHNSFVISQHLTPAPSVMADGIKPVFGSAPYPKVRMDAPAERNDNDSESLLKSPGVISPFDMDDNATTTRSEDTVDAFSSTGFLKLIENHGTRVDHWSVLRHKLQGRLQLELLLHQIHGICWMHGMENLEHMGLNSLLWEERQFPEGDSFYYSPALGQVRLRLCGGSALSSQIIKGGILADEMGLGKTVQVLGLVLATIDELREQASRLPSNYNHATLVVVPPALVSQWISEVFKIAGDFLAVDFFDHKQRVFRRQSQHEEQTNTVDQRPADIVITTYQALEKGKSNRADATRILTSTIWGRVVLDEMQEVRSWTHSISKTCQLLESNRRWMLSGTPLLEGVQDFRGELCFLGLEPFAANNDDGFFDFAISRPWEGRSKHALDVLRILSLVMLRRSKSMTIRETGMPLIGLKPLALTFELVPQDASERALYCFTEYLMHSMLKEADKRKECSQHTMKEDQRNKTVFLRLLRQLCLSPFLLNGGLGCTSQMTLLDRLMRRHHRDQQETVPDRAKDEDGQGTSLAVLSCDEAIRYLSQVEDVARTSDDFVTDLRVGGGAGVSRRDRARLVSPIELFQRNQTKLKKLQPDWDTAMSERAKARWISAVESVTTGGLDDSFYAKVESRMLKLWKWRRLYASQARLVKDTPKVSLLARGWRPGPKFLGLESKKGKGREAILEQFFLERGHFRFAHPFALLLTEIPRQVTSDELLKAFIAFIESFASAKPSVRVVSLSVNQASDAKNWAAFVHFGDSLVFDKLFTKLKRGNAIPVSCAQAIDQLGSQIEIAKQTFDAAMAQYKVHPCPQNRQQLSIARKAYKEMQDGLSIRYGVRIGDSKQILCTQSFGDIRSQDPQNSKSLLKKCSQEVDKCTRYLDSKRNEINRLEAQVHRLQTIVTNGISQHIESLNAFDALQALKSGQSDNTSCPICFDALGESEGSDGKVSLTRCGHLACRECLDHWMREKERHHRAPSCIECRKPIDPGTLVLVDPNKTLDETRFQNRLEKAVSLIQEAAEMLDKNNGQLEPHLWEALYLAMQLPTHVNRSCDAKCPAVPGHVLGHLRNATGLPINQPADQATNAHKLPSKIRALLADLPRDELSVVFASSNAPVRHVLHILELHGIGCRGLFTGQSEVDSEKAIKEWRTNADVFVLVIQSGAAACGLTLTDACKMFILEPFLKHEEEKQAYARLHRFGQTRPVSCKVYYTPVSIESRLMEWRRLALAHEEEDEKIVYAPLRDVTNLVDEENLHEVAEENQTSFLLGLNNELVV